MEEMKKQSNQDNVEDALRMSKTSIHISQEIGRRVENVFPRVTCLVDLLTGAEEEMDREGELDTRDTKKY